MYVSSYPKSFNCFLNPFLQNVSMATQLFSIAHSSIIEIQSTAEGKTFSKEEFDSMFNFARNGIDEIIKFQSEILK